MRERRNEASAVGEANSGAYVLGIIRYRNTCNYVDSTRAGKTLHPTLDICTQPLQTLIQTVSRCSTCGLRNYQYAMNSEVDSGTDLDIPGSLPESVKPQFVSDLSCVHRIRQVLLVSEDEEESITELIFIEHSLKFFPSLRNTLSIIRVDHENDSLSVLEVCKCYPPSRIAHECD
jgi:hypothetical protein